jgi:AcrR family transcriptional regulator
MSLFARDGYTRTSVDAIAAAAGVSKRTVYDYYGDKNHLFLAVLEEAQAGRQARFTDIVRQTLGGDVGDPQAALMAFGRELAVTLARSPDRAAIVRLVVTEAPHFPSLLERWRSPQPEQRTLAAALTALADRGLLDLADPLEAAAQLAILVATPINDHTLFGALPITDDELERLVGSGVRLFLRAYRPGG